jgi:stage II sporulation protein P
MVIVVIAGITRYFVSLKKDILSLDAVEENQDIANLQEDSKMLENSLFSICLSNIIPGIASINEDKNFNEESESILAKILKVEFGIFEKIENAVETEIIEVANATNQEDVISEDIDNKTEEKTEKVEEVATDVTTEVVTNSEIADTYTNQYDNIKIKNQTSYEITEDIFNEKLTLTNKNILIFHTHTCESYTPSENYQYTQTGNFRTTDKNYSVARVGEELKKYLAEYGYDVVHDSTYHDYPAYTGSYSRSLETVSNLLETQDAEIIIDLHRDAIGSNSDYAPTVKIGDEYAAQLMFVIGTDGGGLWHPNWKKNLQFAIAVQKKAEEMYPGLFKSIIVRNSRYNQHLGEAACIIEVGATGNTLEQCLVSQKYLAKIFDEVLKDIK